MMIITVQLISLCVALFGLAGCVQLEDFYPFGAAAGDQELAGADDGVSPPLRLEEQFPYYDREEQVLYVNTNGLLSFGAPSSHYNPHPFPLVSQNDPHGGTFKVVAPFWGDVDNTNPGSGQIWYRQITTNTTLLSQAKKEISEYFLLYQHVNLRDFNPLMLVIVTWDHVGYFQGHSDKTNTFQCVLVTDGRISFVMFLYAEDEIEWTTGDSGGGTNGLGGTPAQAGFNSGDGIRSYSLPLSQNNQIVDIDQLPGNTQEKGLWIFQVDQSEIISGECSNDGSINLLSNRGNILGGSSIVVTGPCFDDYKQVFCHFSASLGGISPEAIVLDDHRALCVVPQLGSVGRSTFKLRLVNQNNETIESQEKHFFSLPSSQSNQVNYLNGDLLFEAGSVVELTWTATDVLSVEKQHAYSIDVALYGLIRQGNAASWTEISQIVTNVSNTGQANVTLPTLQVYHNESAYLAISFLIRFSQPLSLTNQSYSYDLLSVPAGIWSRESYYSYEGGPSRERCIAWASFSQARLTERLQIDDLPPCPCNFDQAKAPNSGFHRVHHAEFFNAAATVCYYQSTPTKTMSARQCCYDDTGGLIDGAPGGGHSDFISPLSDPQSPHLFQLLHFQIDTVPFLDCCKAEESLCLEYYKFRPSTRQSCQHSKCVPAFVYGDPHFVTLDGYRYTFNGKGEFILIETDDRSFTLQGRMTEVATAEGMPSTATVLSALVAKQIDSDTVQFEISRQGINVLVNGELVELSTGSEIPAWNAVISRFGELKYGVRFSCGVNIEMKRQMDYLSAVIVSLPESFMNHTMGLLGHFNGNQKDDLLPASGFDPLPLDSDLLAIHEGFGLFWLITSPENSLFTYPPHKRHDDYFDPWFASNIYPTFASQELEKEATILCNDDKFCLYDVAVTGQLEAGNLTKMTSQRRMELIDLSRPIICDPPCQNGTCVQNNTCNCRAGYSGPTCNIENLMEGCVGNPCLNRGSCRKLGDDSLCQCSSFTSGFNCQQNVPFSYNCSSSLEMGWLVVRCSFNKPVENTVCNLDCKMQLPCTLPLQLDLANLEINSGNHKLRITATDVTGLNQTAVVTFSVEPLNFTCKSGLRDQQLMISNCSSNNLVKSVECSLNKNGLIMKKCELPLTQNLNNLPAGRYVFNVSATDIYKLNDTFLIEYTKEPLKLSLINSSPRIWAGQIIADFTVNREKGQFTVTCDLGRQKERNCTNGYVRYDSVPNGTFILRITARSENGDRDVVRRKIVIRSKGDSDYCAAHFINTGVDVYGRSVKVQFHGTQSSISYYMCKLDNNPFIRCASPYRLENLVPGEHKIKIAPVCVSPDQRPYRTTAKFTIH